MSSYVRGTQTDDWRANIEDQRPEGVAKPRIETHPEKDGVRLVDPIEGVDFTLLTSEPVEPVECGTDNFYFPVDTAVSIDATEIETPRKLTVWVRDTEGELIAHNKGGKTVSVPEVRCSLDLVAPHIKIYLRADGPLNILTNNKKENIKISDLENVVIGIRSLHEHPATTITTTESPEDLMQAVSVFSSALKTTSCERSYPSLRGHPPLLKIGDELKIPDSIHSPQTDITLRVPPQYDYLYPITSLSFYLGAAIEVGDRPELVVDGARYPLDRNNSFETEVERVHKQIFLLDCITRTEGYFDTELQERGFVEQRIDIDFSSVYQMDLTDQVQTYLSLPYDEIKEALPDWKLTADISPVSKYAETLPFLANELATIRCRSTSDVKQSSLDVKSEMVEQFFDSISEGERDLFSRGVGGIGEPSPIVFQPDHTDSVEHVFLGDGIPLDAGKMTPDAFFQRLSHNIAEKEYAEVAVICNDSSMIAENEVSDIYSQIDGITSTVSVQNNVTAAELSNLFRKHIDFIHYIGHVDEDGIKCSDGYLDAQSLKNINIKSFLLNACDSYTQGRALVECGARGGVTTLSKISNDQAVEFGRRFAQLLTKGLPLCQCLSLIEKLDRSKSEFIALGDPATQVVKSPSGVAEVYIIETLDSGLYSISNMHRYNIEYGLGTFISHLVIEDIDSHLCGNGEQNVKVSEDKIKRIINDPQTVSLLDGDLLESFPD